MGREEYEVQRKVNVVGKRIITTENLEEDLKIEGELRPQRLTDYIGEHLDEELSLDSLAGEFYVSKYHIAHVFKDHIGISIHQYIMKKRLSACRDAIRNGTKITEAYLMYGFKDYSGFYRAFKKEYGMSPKEWQEINRKLLSEP